MNPATMKQMTQQLQRIESEQSRLNALASHFRGVISFYSTTDENDKLRRNPGDVLKDDIQNVLRTEAQPMHPKDILARLEEQGIAVPGENPAHNLRSHMSGDSQKRFYALGDDTWGLTGWTLMMNLRLDPNGNANGAGPALEDGGMMSSDLLEDGQRVAVRFRATGADEGACQLDPQKFREVVSECCRQADVTDMINQGATVKITGGTASLFFHPDERDESTPRRIPGTIRFTQDEAGGDGSSHDSLFLLQLEEGDAADLVLEHVR